MAKRNTTTKIKALSHQLWAGLQTGQFSAYHEDGHCVLTYTKANGWLMECKGERHTLEPLASIERVNAHWIGFCTGRAL